MFVRRGGVKRSRWSYLLPLRCKDWRLSDEIEKYKRSCTYRFCIIDVEYST